MTGPAPYQPKPSIVDRLLGRLFPTEQYAGLLDSGAQHSLQQQGLLNLGTGILAQTGPGNALSAFGRAYQALNFPEMAHQALQLQSLKAQQQEQALIAQAGARHPAQPGESRTDAYGRLTAIISDIATVPGGDAIAAKLAPVLAALKPDKPGEAQRIPGVVDTRLGSPTIGQSGTFLVPFPGAPRESWTFIKGEPKQVTPKEPTPQERVANSQYESAQTSIAAMREIARRNPAAAKQAVGAIKASRWGPLGQLVTEARGTLTDPDAQTFYTHYNNMILSVTPTYGGSRPTQPLMDLEKQATLPAIGSGDFETAFHHMDNRLRDLKAKAGKAFQQPAAPATPTPAMPVAGAYDDLLKP